MRANRNYLPPSPMAEWFGRTIYRVMGWRVEGELPKLDKYIIIGAHHTSNWDFVVMLAFKCIVRLNPHFFAKHTLFFGPLGWVMRKLGGVPVARHRNNNLVASAITAFKENEQFILGLSPEGTRAKVERWKMGFYHIAMAAHVPVVPVGLDFAEKRLVIGPPEMMSGDQKKDTRHLVDFFRPYPPKRPGHIWEGPE